MVRTVSPGQIEGVGGVEPEVTPRRWSALTVLVLGYGAMIIPSVGIAVLLEPIKHEFGLSDSAEGAIPGMSMVLAFILFGIPAGLLVDRINRRNLLVGAMLIGGRRDGARRHRHGFLGYLGLALRRRCRSDPRAARPNVDDRGPVPAGTPLDGVRHFRARRTDWDDSRLSPTESSPCSLRLANCAVRHGYAESFLSVC